MAVQKLFQDTFFKQNAIFFVGSLIVAVLNYAFHPVMSRMLSVEEFGDVQALISLTYITGILLIIFRTIVTNVVSHDSEENHAYNARLLSQIVKVMLYGLGLVATALIFLSPLIASALKLGAALPIVPIALLLVLGVFFHFYSAYLQGLKSFGAVSIANMIVAGGKLLFAVLFVFLGMGVFGAVFAIVSATLLALFYAFLQMRKRFTLQLVAPISEKEALTREFSYGWLVFCSLGFVTFFYTSDVLFVKYFFPADEAGLYSGIATIARIIFFATASVAAVLLPTIQRTAPEKENLHALRKALFIIAGMGLVALVGFWLLPELIITLLMGSQYLVFASLLPLAGLYLFLVSVINLFYAYFLALRDSRIIVVSVIGLITLGALLTYRHASPGDIVQGYLMSAGVTLVCVLTLFLRKTPQS